MAIGDLAAPHIPLLVNNTVDPESLGGANLDTYVKYDNPQVGDQIYQSWLGLASDGTPVDYGNVPIAIDPLLEGELGFLMQVSNAVVTSLDKGQAFYSYFLERITGEPKEESKRIHFGIGRSDRLSAPQLKESHDNQLDLNVIDGSITVTVVPYNAMSKGDVVKLIWEGKRQDGQDGPVVNLAPKTLTDEDTDPTNNPGEVLSWRIEKSHVTALRDGSITLSYEVTPASSAADNYVSTKRMFVVVPPTLPELAIPSVKGLQGTEIEPNEFPEGIFIQVPFYPGIRIGDDVLVYGTRTGSGSSPLKNIIKFLKIDASNIETGTIEVPVDIQWWVDNRGGSVSIRYQYARADAAGSGVPLELTVKKRLALPKPTVDGSIVLNDRNELNPGLVVSGAYVTLSEETPISPDDEVTVYWKGFDALGSYEVSEPSQVNPMKFKIPPEVMPSNFAKTVEVTYSVEGQMALEPFELYIRPLPSYPSISCEGVEVGSPATLSLSGIPDAGAKLSIERWPFISTEQQLRLWLTGRDVEERDLIAVRNLLPEEVSGGVVVALFKEDLAGIALQSTFSFKASISFDGGGTTVSFGRPLMLKLLP